MIAPKLREIIGENFDIVSLGIEFNTTYINLENIYTNTSIMII